MRQVGNRREFHVWNGGMAKQGSHEHHRTMGTVDCNANPFQIDHIFLELPRTLARPIRKPASWAPDEIEATGEDSLPPSLYGSNRV